MEIVLVVAVLVVAAAVLYIAVTLGPRTRQSSAPLIEDATRDISGKVEVLQATFTALAGELQQDRDQTRLEGRKIQGRLDHADSRTGSIANRLLAEIEAIKRLSEQISAQQDQLSEDLQQLEHQITQLQAARPAPDSVTAAPALAVIGRLYAERLQFSIIRIQPESFSRSERRYRIQIERAIAELPAAQPGDPGDASAITERANSDDLFRERLGKAASDYLATKWEDPAFAMLTERWETQNTFPETDVAAVCNRIGNGLDVIVERPPQKIGTELRLPGPEAAAAAGIGSDLILQPVTEAIGQVTKFLEITGVVVGAATGLRPLALAAAKMLAHDQFHDWIARGIREAARTVFDRPAGPPEGPAAGEPATAPGPVQPPAEPAESRAAESRPAESRPAESRPAETGPSPTDTWWQIPIRRNDPHEPDGPAIGGLDPM
jgi:hypothetical protein